MLYGDQDNRVGLRFSQLFFDVTNGIRVVGNAIDQEILEFIGGDDDDTCVDMAVLEVVANMNDVSRKQIASTGYLNFDAEPVPRFALFCALSEVRSGQMRGARVQE